MSSNATDPLETVLGRLQGVKSAGQERWVAYCPSHESPPEGHKRSLSVSRGDDGRALVHCHAGCGVKEICSAMGIREEDLFPAKMTKQRPAAKRTAPGSKIVATYDYRDATGKLLFQVVRYEPKDFRQRRPDGNGGWTWKLDGVPRVLYRLPELLAAPSSEWVFVPEGEKDVDNVRALSLVGTTNPGGAGTWHKLDDDSALHGRRVAVLGDKDAQGRKHAGQVARALNGKAAEVRIVELPGEGKDVSDWIESLDCRMAEELRTALLELAAAAPIYETPTVGPVLVRVADVRPEPLAWLWPGRIPLGKVTVLSGDPGLGKSLITLDIAARVSTGTPWPDSPDIVNPAGSVVLLSAEDDIADTIRPRLDAAGADVNRIAVLEAVNYPDPQGDTWQKKMFSLRRDLSALEKAVTKTGSVRLIVIDPLTAYLDGTDSHKCADVRGLLAPLSELAARYKVAVLAVSHLNKNPATPAMYRTMGSLAFVAAARAVWVVTKDKDNGTRRLVVPVKHNLAHDTTGMAYTIQDELGIPLVAWESDPVTISADEALADPFGGNREELGEREQAAEWLRNMLASGPVGTEEIKQAAREAGFSWATVKRAKALAGVEPFHVGYGTPWQWRLKSHSCSTDPIVAQPLDVSNNDDGEQL